MSNGNDGSKLVWGIVTVTGLIAIAYAGWLGITTVSNEARLTGIEAKLDILMSRFEARNRNDSTVDRHL